MNAMHARGNDKAIQNIFKRKEQPPVTVMKLSCQFKNNLVNKNHDRSRTNDKNSKSSEEHRCNKFTDMKTHSGCNIEIDIRVMDQLERDPGQGLRQMFCALPRKTVHHHIGKPMRQLADVCLG